MSPWHAPTTGFIGTVPRRSGASIATTARWGALADIGTHHLDLLRMLLGEVVDAHGLTGHELGFETEDVGAATLRFESGVLATLTATVNVWKMATRVEVHGTKGALVALDTNPAGAGTATLITADGERDITGERPASLWAAQVDAIEAAAAGDGISYATGEDGAAQHRDPGAHRLIRPLRRLVEQKLLVELRSSQRDSSVGAHCDGVLEPDAAPAGHTRHPDQGLERHGHVELELHGVCTR